MRKGWLAIVVLVVAGGGFMVGARQAGSPAEKAASPVSAAPLMAPAAQTGALSVYLTGTGSGGVLSPTAIAANLGAQLVSTWQDVIAIDTSAAGPIDVLIIDNGSLSDVDWTWASGRVNTDLVIAGINVRAHEIFDNFSTPYLANFLSSNAAYDYSPYGASDEFYSVILAIGHANSGGDEIFALSDKANGYDKFTGLPIGVHLYPDHFYKSVDNALWTRDNN